MTKDWVQWHRGYDQPSSSLARRLEIVQHCLHRALTDVSSGKPRELQLISICAGDERDVLPVLAAHDSASRARVVLVDSTRT
jgi:hypothetical protein